VKDTGAKVIREALQVLLQSDEQEFTIYNNTEYLPQLEISRFPESIRQHIYETKDYSIEDNANRNPSKNASFISRSATNFFVQNAHKFNYPPTTNKSPLPHEESTGGTPTYHLYTDASFNPDTYNTAISYVIIGGNGGVYGYSKRVDDQAINRAELLAVVKGIRKILNETPRESRIIANTDNGYVCNSANGTFTIDGSLSRSLNKYLDRDDHDITVNKIDRSQNNLPDALSKVSRKHNQAFKLGKL
jgi:ribonuclease HI